MRLLVVAPSSIRWGCGVGDHATRLAEAMASRGLDVHLATDETAPRRREPSATVTTHCIFRRHGFADMGAAARLARRIAPDLVHIQYQIVTYSGRAAVLTLPLLLGDQAAIAITMHDFLLPHVFRGTAPLRRRLLRRFLVGSRAILVASATHRARALEAGARSADIRGIVMPSNIEFLPISAAREEVLRARYAIGERTLLTCFGAVSLGGGAELVLRAIAAVPRAARTGLKCLIVGGAPAYSPDADADLQAVRHLARRLDLGECVEVTGFLDDQEVSALLQISRAVIQPRPGGVSPTSGTIAAAIHHRKPVLAVGGGEHLDESMVGGAIHWSAPEPGALGNAISKLLHGDALWHGGVQAELDASAHRFSWEHLAGQHCIVYDEISTQRR